MTSAASSSLVSGPDCSSPSLSQIADLNMAPSLANNQQRKVPHGPVAILWDIENCPVPNDVRPEDVAGNIRMALRRLREGCQRTGVKLVDVPNGRKDAADKAILVDMFLFALDNPPPSSILLISVLADLFGIGQVWPEEKALCQQSHMQPMGRMSFMPYLLISLRAPILKWKKSRSSTRVYQIMDAQQGDLSELQYDHWVQPGDVQGLKGQIVKLLELSAGSLQLVRLPSEYQKMFGRPLYVSEYGSCKLVDLLKKMADSVTVEGKGNRKWVTLRSSAERSQSFFNAPAGSSRKEIKGKEIVREESISGDGNELLCAGFQNMACYSDESTDDERESGQGDRNPGFSVGPTIKVVTDVCLDQFRVELQELLVSYSCRILMSSFEALYEQRYKKPLNYQSFGVCGLEELIKKVKDVAEIHEEQTTKRKVLMVSGLGGLGCL
ncbi:unnamed protein product [Victoria cruziana]